jgi:hypothetical protein
MTTKQKAIFIVFSVFIFCSFQVKAQNLQFNSAIFNEYGPFPGDGDPVTPFHTVQIVVGPNQVLKLIVVRATGINLYQATNPNIVTPISPTSAFSSINDNWVNWTTDENLYLPSGTYTFKFFEVPIYLGTFKGLINGILYDIVP